VALISLASPSINRSTDLLGGQVDMMCDNLGVSLPHVRSGKLKALAVASKQRFAGLPDVPGRWRRRCPASSRAPGTGIVAPAKDPCADRRRKVSAGVADALKKS